MTWINGGTIVLILYKPADFTGKSDNPAGAGDN